ncbi:hypothetical protein JT359_15870 [Candidatus Poribacteria bacterium]|nr:hypothetical protein [Candidatus Poribacteria bacterium]
MYRKLILAFSLIVGVAIVFIVNVWYDTNRFEESLKSSDKTPTTVKPSDYQVIKPPTQNNNKKIDITANNGKDNTQNSEEVVTKPTEKTQTPQGTQSLTDPVAAAWARLDYISKNIYEYGEEFSPKTTELMEQLKHTWNIPGEEGRELSIELLTELANLRDPRSAEAFIQSIFENRLSGKLLTEGLVSIGPPSVPLLIPYLDDRSSGRFDVTADVLSLVGEKYRSELGGAVEYIIIPKLETIVASETEKLGPFGRFDKQIALQAIARLKQ